MTSILIIINPGTDLRVFRDTVATIKEMGGQWDAAAKVWTVDPGHYIVTMHRRHAAERNERHPELEPVDATALGVISSLIGRHTEIVEIDETPPAISVRDLAAEIGHPVEAVTGMADQIETCPVWADYAGQVLTPAAAAHVRAQISEWYPEGL